MTDIDGMIKKRFDGRISDIPEFSYGTDNKGHTNHSYTDQGWSYDEDGNINTVEDEESMYDPSVEEEDHRLKGDPVSDDGIHPYELERLEWELAQKDPRKEAHLKAVLGPKGYREHLDQTLQEGRSDY